MWRECKPFIGLVVVIVIYAIVRVASATLAGSQGVLTPSGAVDTRLAALVVATFVLRVVVLFVVPLIAIYRLVMRALR
ncbi:MAG TPA: hypothetical protein VF403_09405 [Kofleriaceae bacterium]